MFTEDPINKRVSFENLTGTIIELHLKADKTKSRKNDIYHMDRETKLKIRNLEKEIQDLKVVIDTCQSTLRSAQSHLKKYPADHDAVFNVPSAKWVLEYKL